MGREGKGREGGKGGVRVRGEEVDEMSISLVVEN